MRWHTSPNNGHHGFVAVSCSSLSAGALTWHGHEELTHITMTLLSWFHCAILLFPGRRSFEQAQAQTSCCSPVAGAPGHKLAHINKPFLSWFRCSILLFPDCRSFELAWAWRRQTASDTVHAITALLEVTTAKQAAADDDAKDRFWRAWSALSVEHASSELKHGFELSKKLQQGILKYGFCLHVCAFSHVTS